MKLNTKSIAIREYTGKLQKIEDQRQFDIALFSFVWYLEWNYWIKSNLFDAKLREENSLIPRLIGWPGHSKWKFFQNSFPCV